MPTCGDFHIELYDIERKEPLPEYGHGYKGNSLIRLVPCETGRTFGVFVSALLPLEEHETVDFHAGIDIYIDGYSKPASSSGVLHLVDLPPEEDLTVTEVTGGIFINEAGEPVKTSWRFKEIDVADALDSLAIKAVPGNQPEDRDALTNQLELMRLQNESYDDVRSEPGQVVVSLHKLTGVTVEPWSNEDLPKAKKRTKKQKPVAGQSHYVTSSFQREDDVTDTMLAGEEGPELARVTFVYRDMKYLRARFTPAQLQQGLDGPTWSSVSTTSSSFELELTTQTRA